MKEKLLDGVRVVDLTGEPALMAGRILADLGADVVRVIPPGPHPLEAWGSRLSAWFAGTAVLTGDPAEDQRVGKLLGAAHVVLDTPGWPGTVQVKPNAAPQAVWVSVTPFGLDGPRAHWRASDLGVMASSGNMYATGDPDRAPVRCTEPSGYCHVGAETALAALTALASGFPHHVDVSMQETILVANMVAVARAAKSGFRGRRLGANIGRTREIWPCKDGYVSFGLRGGKARVPSLQLVTRLVDEAGLGTPALTDRDWTAFNQNTATDEELRAIEEPIARFFAQKTMQELYEIACATNLMLAPANSPREIYASAQLEARQFFGPHQQIERFPSAFVVVRSADGEALPARPDHRAGVPRWDPAAAPPGAERGRPAWAGTKIVEFGAGAAGPIATRYFAEHGATVVRVESKTRPDFLRVYALGPDNPHGLEGSEMFDGLNAGKLGVTLNLKHPDGVGLARRLVHWADAVAENFAPRAMKSLGLDYDTLSQEKPDLVMVSACLNGQTGPHRDYPGFGGQGAALSGFNFLTGWPDREPLGPFGTITDSLAPRFVATALAGGLLYRRRTGRGVYLDVAQVETALYSLSPWLLDYYLKGKVTTRMGNADATGRAIPHGAFPCSGDDRWIAIACWTDDERERLAKATGLTVDEVVDEARLAAWTAERSNHEIAEELQAAGIEAVPVWDFVDLVADPQLAHRQHFVTLTHPVMGEGLYERNGFRLSAAPSGYERPGPTLGEHNDFVLGEVLGLTEGERARLQAAGALD